jgi:hypothetical protein
MLGRWTILAAVLGTAAFARAANPAATCELARADRARTPSSRCLACHDGTSGQCLGLSHPVEVDYARAAMRDPGRYVPASALPADVPLVNGRVSCVSCHDGASTHPAHTVEPARLCLACHRM